MHTTLPFTVISACAYKPDSTVDQIVWFVIHVVIDWESRNYGSKPADSQERSPRERFVYVAIFP